MVQMLTRRRGSWLEYDAADGVYYTNSSLPTVWNPIPPFNLSDATVSLIIISQPGQLFIEPVADPLFFANTSHSISYDGMLAITEYKASFPLNLLFCSEQAELCDSVTGECSDRMSLFGLDSLTSDDNPWYKKRTPTQKAIALRMTYIATLTGLGTIARGTQAL